MGAEMDTIESHQRVDSNTPSTSDRSLSEKKGLDVEIDAVDSNDFNDIPDDKVFIPDESDVVIDPRLKNYPIPLVAKTVDLHNDPT
jgi:hypothetical protein